MLCGIHPHSSPHHRGFLHSFRSHKNLKQRKNTSSVGSQAEMIQYHRRRAPSDASSSSLARPSMDSSRRPSTSSSRTTASIDWDPLRLHPSQTRGPAPPLRDTFTSESSTSRRYQPRELRQALSGCHSPSSQASSSPPPTRQTSPSSNTVIYDGFDFGFNNTPTPTTMRKATTTSTAPIPIRRPRAPSPTPSDASSECSLALSGSSYQDESSLPLEDLGLCLGLAPAPAPRPRPRPRPLDRNHGDGPAGEAEDFLRRGGWKRRGIVFVNATGEEAGEDESWEI